MTDSIVARSNATRPIAARLGVLCAVALAVALPAHAEDIEVYEALTDANGKPNILFVLDYSGSMNQDIENGNAGSSGLPRKIDVLRDTIRQVLDDNKDTIRAGLGSLYTGRVSGVRWPITDLDVDANAIDPGLPAGKYTARDIIDKQLDGMTVTGDTRTVNALVEAAMYFRGGAVTHGGGDPRHSSLHDPGTWDDAAGRYTGGHPFAAVPASYLPSGAYARGAGQTGDFGICRDFSGSGGTNGCAGKITYDCQAVAEGTRKEEQGVWRRMDAHFECRHEHPDHWSGANYVSPIETAVATAPECRADSAIVLISDGIPDKAFDDASLQEVIGMPYAGCTPLHDSVFHVPADDTTADGNCGPEVTRALASNDQLPGIDSKIKTYTVGFSLKGPGQEYLQLLANPGPLFGESVEASREKYGEYFPASSAAELSAALTEVIEQVGGGNESFVEVSVDIDKASFSHDERAYFSLFAPSRKRAWRGNLKGYFLDKDKGLLDVDGQPAVVEVDGTTRFDDGARSFWSGTDDGDDPLAGGASARLATSARRLYTYTGDTGALPSTGIDLAASPYHTLTASNSGVSAEHLGLPAGSAMRAAAIDWLQQAPMGDPLHSKSVSVSYADGRRVVYVMTNQGLLHAIDATLPVAPDGTGGGGTELFAYMPKRLLPNLPALAADERGGPHIYGLDGTITRWHDDTDNDGVVDSGESLMLVLGMRRGGEAYHAIDVSDPDRPLLEWVVDSTRTGFAELAQSWSRASLVSVRRGGGEERVLMFGGGYDAARLDGEDKRHDSRGNAIFVLDRAGNLVRKFTRSDHAKMTYAFAADLSVIDSDADGLADRIYAADLGGQVWRIDFDDIDVATGSRVTLLAELHDGRHQPFFSAPSVALNRRAGGDFLSVSLGSGNRTEPLDRHSENAFFMLRDTDVDKGFPDSSRPSIKTSELYDASADLLGSADADTAQSARAALADARGWRVNLARGEKSLSRIVSFDGTLLATTYLPPEGSTSGACRLEPTQYFYRMDIETARPTRDDVADDSLTSSARRAQPLTGVGIPSAPALIFPPGSSTVQVMVDRKRVDLLEQRLTRVYWHAK